MPMTPFVERFPELGARETKSAKILDPQDLPVGEYGFFEFYCDEPGCDCRRVTIFVLRPETGWSKVWATITYGWETLDFYREWGGEHSDPVEMKGPDLDILNRQSEYSPALLRLFESLIESPAYVERLKRHYGMFRESVDSEHGYRVRQEFNRLQNRRKRLRDPRRR